MDKDLEVLNDFYERAMQLAHEWGLQPFPVDFHVVPAHKIYEVASYGIPGHFSHWSYGKDYWQMKSGYDRGHSRIYELVINSDPAQAFLLDTNTLLDNLFVIAHVLGHSDFFARSAYFEHTNRRMEVSARIAAERFRDYELQHGRDVVEAFIDDVFSIEEHIDPHLRTKDKAEDYEIDFDRNDYLDLMPEEVERRKLVELEETDKKQNRFPREPERDIMDFVAIYGRLKPWQQDIIQTIRTERLYFLPQMQTKIMNEGWASIIHHEMMQYLDVECDPGGIDFADVHSGVLNPSPGMLNPYWIGYNIFKRIMCKEDEDQGVAPEDWGKPNGPGWKKCLEIIEIERDETFLRNYLDEQLITDLDLFTFEYDKEEDNWWVSSKDWEKVRDTLVASKANMGMPYIVVQNGDYIRAGQLYLKHNYDGRPLEEKWAAKTLRSLNRLWGRPVLLETIIDDKKTVIACTSELDHISVEKEGEKVYFYD